MRWLLLAPIRMYWRFWPSNWKRECLYSESCSRFVYRVTELYGFRVGARALLFRFRECRPNNGPHKVSSQLSVARR
jgi:putative component of membrane protein insertase Oxa1/YidC/SpoIIIJ protein YidD